MNLLLRVHQSNLSRSRKLRYYQCLSHSLFLMHLSHHLCCHQRRLHHHHLHLLAWHYPHLQIQQCIVPRVKIQDLQLKMNVCSFLILNQQIYNALGASSQATEVKNSCRYPVALLANKSFDKHNLDGLLDQLHFLCFHLFSKNLSTSFQIVHLLNLVHE